MTDQPYTSDDLRAEAARQHHTVTGNPVFNEIAEQMRGSRIPSTVADAEAPATTVTGGRTWDMLAIADFRAAHHAIDHLRCNAADVSGWAVNLGADGLEPEEHEVTLKSDERPIVRVHFAFAPELSERTREAFVMAIGEAAAHGMGLTNS